MLISVFFLPLEKKVRLTVSKSCRMQTTGKHVPKKQVLTGNILCWEGVTIGVLVALRGGCGVLGAA